MKKLIIVLVVYLLFVSKSYAYKVYSYDNNGNRVYRTIEQKDFARYKNAPRRTFVRTPRTNWEITDRMRARKLTSSQFTHR
ncbi:MAG: hypothetical protein IJ312_07665 [Treponema sp.]|nr:hypothetical protein [Treponema sp.]